MGLYVEGVNKNTWLDRVGIEVSMNVVLSHEFDDDVFPVVWINNGPFIAIGVGFSPTEVKAFCQPTDHRQKRFYLVEASKLKPVCPQWDSYL